MASFSLSNTIKSSPALAAPLIPSISTGDDGSAAEMVMPGDNIKFVVTLICPIAMDEGLRFAIREGGRTVGAGVVSKVID